MGSHRLVNELVGNRQQRDKLQAELDRLTAERDELIAQARLLNVPASEIEWAAGLRG
jgi:cell division protein FtsB